MASFDELSALLAELKGARASILWALSLAGRPLSLSELLALTGYSRKPVRRAVRELLELGFVRQDGPRVLVLTGQWPYQVVDLTPAADQKARGKSPKKPAESAPEIDNTVIDNSVVDNTVIDSTNREEEMRRAVEEKRRVFLAGRLAATTAGISAETASLSAAVQSVSPPGPIGHEGGLAGYKSGQIAQSNQPVVVVDPDPDQGIDQQQQQIPDGAGRLAALLRQMGINGRAYWRLVQRADLAARPEVVLAWWWYYRVQESIRNPAGAAISRLDSRDDPPEGYLALARLWPTLDDAVRQELESLVLYNWSAEQIAARLRPECPGLTPGAVLAFMTLSLEELEG